jgi:hypothetical protein
MSEQTPSSRRAFFHNTLTKTLGLVGLTVLAESVAASSVLQPKLLSPAQVSSLLPHEGNYVGNAAVPLRSSCPTENPDPLFQFWLNDYTGNLPFHMFQAAHQNQLGRFTHRAQIGPYLALLAEKSTSEWNRSGIAYPGPNNSTVSMHVVHGVYDTYVSEHRDENFVLLSSVTNTWDTLPKYPHWGTLSFDTLQQVEGQFWNGRIELIRHLAGKGILV